MEISRCDRVVPQRKRRIKKQISRFQDLLNNANLRIVVDFYATWYCLLEQVGVQLRDRLDYPPYTDKIKINQNYFLQKHDAKYADFPPVSPEFPIAFSQY